MLFSTSALYKLRTYLLTYLTVAAVVVCRGTSRAQEQVATEMVAAGRIAAVSAALRDRLRDDRLLHQRLLAEPAPAVFDRLHDGVAITGMWVSVGSAVTPNLRPLWTTVVVAFATPVTGLGVGALAAAVGGRLTADGGQWRGVATETAAVNSVAVMTMIRLADDDGRLI